MEHPRLCFDPSSRSSWGHDFRPSYRRIAPLLQALNVPRLLALTASAPPVVRDDIVQQLGMGEQHLRLVASCRRDNIVISRGVKSAESLASVLSKGKGGGKGGGASSSPSSPSPSSCPPVGPALVYVQTRREVDELAIALADAGLHVLRYHAGMPAAQRASAQEEFLLSGSDDLVMIATNAFGMGIDKPDIRTVVHYGPSGTVEAYYQELGRGGRDGLPTRAVLLLNDKEGMSPAEAAAAAAADMGIHYYFLNFEYPTLEEVSRVWKGVLSLATDAAPPATTQALKAAGIELPDEAADLVLACSATELQDAASAIVPESGSKRRSKVMASAKCLRILRAWGYLERTQSRTSVTLLDDSSGSLVQQVRSKGGGAGGAEIRHALPSDMKGTTNQARAWLALARNVGLAEALQKQAAKAGGGQKAGGGELAHKSVASDVFDDWAIDAGLDQTQFANALRALQTKGLVRVDKSPTVQVRVPGSVREEGFELPTRTDERVQELLQNRKLREDKLKAMERCLACETDPALGENDTLWRYIMQYFGEIGEIGEIGEAKPDAGPEAKPKVQTRDAKPKPKPKPKGQTRKRRV